MKVNEYDVITLDNDMSFAVLVKKSINNKEYLLCQEVIGEELTLSFNIFGLENDELFDIDAEELSLVYNELSKDMPSLTDEQKEHIDELFELINN